MRLGEHPKKKQVYLTENRVLKTQNSVRYTYFVEENLKIRINRQSQFFGFFSQRDNLPTHIPFPLHRRSDAIRCHRFRSVSL